MIAFKKTAVLPWILLITLLLALSAIIGYILHLNTAHEPKQPASTPVPTVSPSSLAFATPHATKAAATATPIPADEKPTPAWQFVDDADQFWMDGILRRTDDSYRSPGLSVNVRTVIDTKTYPRRVMYYVADIYVRDVTQIKTESYSGDFSHPGRGSVPKTAKRVNALLAISGDYCGVQKGSLVIRNGVVYRESLRKDMDTCLLLRDGTMETFRAGKIALSDILQMDVWQAWQFGPLLLENDGEVRSSFASVNIAVQNPRSCIGYVAPGHYMFVVVDGRQKHSRGLTLSELAALMKSLGCTRAFNLDGGASAHFYWRDKIFSSPSKGGRSISDIVYLSKEDYTDSFYFPGKDGLHE